MTKNTIYEESVQFLKFVKHRLYLDLIRTDTNSILHDNADDLRNGEIEPIPFLSFLLCLCKTYFCLFWTGVQSYLKCIYIRFIYSLLLFSIAMRSIHTNTIIKNKFIWIVKHNIHHINNYFTKLGHKYQSGNK